MVGVYTGSDALDNRISSVLDQDNMIIHYPEYFIDGSDAMKPVDILVMSERLEIENLLEYISHIRKKGIRVVLILSNEDSPLLLPSIQLGIYDILFGEKGVKPSDIKYLVENPRGYKDVYDLAHNVEMNIRNRNSAVTIQRKEVTDTFTPSGPAPELEAEDAVEIPEHLRENNKPAEVIESAPPSELPKEPEVSDEPLEVFETTVVEKKRGLFNMINDRAEKEKVVKEVVTEKVIEVLPEDYKKFIAYFGSESAGKTELACNVAISSAVKGKRTLLIDLDPSKFGVSYNFKITEDEYIYYEHLLGKKYEAETFYRDDIAIEYAHKGHRNLYVFTGHLNSDIEISLSMLQKLVRECRSYIEVFVFDIGKGIEQEISDYILSLDGLDKYLVITQNLETVNMGAWGLMLETPSDYHGWKLVINRYVNIGAISETEIIGNLYNTDGNQFIIDRSYYVPDKYAEIVRCKSRRECYYGMDEYFDKAIDEMSSGWYHAPRKKRSLFGR
ncbi:MAG TPA: hypothetical protein VFD57_02920 [Clostridia bacterium]|nr:hypothetical protein [Clostridia bacterium]